MTSNDTNRKAAIRWGGLVVGLLGLQVALGVGAVMLATGDQSAAVVPNYYEKALKWDEQASQRESNDALGWTLAIVESDTDLSASSLRLSVTARDGVAVPIRSGRLAMYHHARAEDVLVKSLGVPVDAADESIHWSGCVVRGGWWQIDVDVVDSQGNRFVESRQIKLSGPKSPPNDASAVPTGAERS